MDSFQEPLPLHQPPPPQPPTSFGDKLKKYLGPFGGLLVLLFNFLGKLKLIILPAIKFLPVILKTGGTMIFSVWAYALIWGWKFAAGFVVLIFVHECGHLVFARRLGLKVGAPVFIPFMGAFIALKDAPRNAWIEAWVGIGGPLFGALGAAASLGVFMVTGNPLYSALAYTGCFLNLFNLAPVGFLDGGRIVTAISPWLWVIGMAVLVAQLFIHMNFLLVMILIMSVPRVYSLFRHKTDEEIRYFEVTSTQRLTMAILYFGLAALLVAGMHYSLVVPTSQTQSYRQSAVTPPPAGS
jgi:Zn-dependent protease